MPFKSWKCHYWCNASPQKYGCPSAWQWSTEAAALWWSVSVRDSGQTAIVTSWQNKKKKMCQKHNQNCPASNLHWSHHNPRPKCCIFVTWIRLSATNWPGGLTKWGGRPTQHVSGVQRPKRVMMEKETCWFMSKQNQFSSLMAHLWQRRGTTNGSFVLGGLCSSKTLTSTHS